MTVAPHILREYALLADGERGALVGPRGELVWMCVPRWDSGAVFSALLGGRGQYAVTPRDRCVWGGFYEPGSLIWNHRWVTDAGTTVECRDALALPAQPGCAVLLRRVLAVAGPARVRVRLDPRADFDQAPLRDLARGEDGVWTGRCGALRMRWAGARDAVPGPDGLVLTLDLPEGAAHDLVLALGDDPDEAWQPEAGGALGGAAGQRGASAAASGEAGAARGGDADAAWRRTEAAWQERVPRLDATAAARDARHAYAVMQGLTSGGGGMVAAATTALPERARAGRNYDYRFVWIRDQCYAGQAVAATGAHPLLDEAVRFVGERLRADGDRLTPAYTTAGEPVPGERRLALPGYPGGAAVVGNRVRSQFQLDVHGEALLLFAAAGRHDHLEPDAWRAAEAAADAVERRWREPDAGVWELDPAHWTHSRLICAAGLRRIGAYSPRRAQAERWTALADALVAAAAVHPSGRWQRTDSDPRVDAALLSPALRGAVPADDPRAVATLRAVLAELTEDGYAYRYRADERPLGAAEGAFLLCGFWVALALHRLGDHVAAARWFERNRAACGSPGLLSEEYDVRRRQLRGNLPQAFVHALMLECAAALAVR
ncbi:MAG TPA: glycoside hydrolase family 15 protein [Solirubrobacter sp.]|nr:glycoside hydrolase family 15 protein [Solirubrobacter sp.]